MKRHLAMTSVVWMAGLLCISAMNHEAHASRVKDIARFTGDRQWTLLGTGLVLGLAGTGDGTGFRASILGLANSLERLGYSVDPTQIRAKNVAMVSVSARLSSTHREGSTLDVKVSSMGDASSLEGGTLLPTNLANVLDGEVYAFANGPVSIGGFNVSAGANNSVQKNHPTVGLVPNGATVVRRPAHDDDGGGLGIVLYHADRTTAANVARAVNQRFPGAAVAEDAGFIRLQLPVAYQSDPVGFEAAVGELESATDAPARVVVNERTGTIVVGAGVAIGEAAVAHGGLTIEIRTRYDVSQPNSFNESGETVVVPDVQARVEEKEAHVLRLPASTTVRDVANILNGMGATPRDIIAILQALKNSGALQAELVTM